MKKITLLIVTVVAFIFIGCGSGGGGDTVSRLDKNATEDSSVDNDTSDGLRAHGVRLKSQYSSSNHGVSEENSTYEYDSMGRCVTWKLNNYTHKKLMHYTIFKDHYKGYQNDTGTYKIYDSNDTLIQEGSTKLFYNNLKQLTKIKNISTYYKTPKYNSKLIWTVDSWDGIYATKETLKHYDFNDTLIAEEVWESVWDGDKISSYTDKIISYKTVPPTGSSLDVSLEYDEQGRKTPGAYMGEDDTQKYGKSLFVYLGTYIINKSTIISSQLEAEIISIPRKSATFNDEGLLMREDISDDFYTTYEYENY